MKPSIRVALATALISAFLPSCHKVYEYIKDHPDAYRTPCRITNYRVTASNGAHSNYLFTYNSAGNPVSIMDSDRVQPIGIDQYFRYDRFGRLSDYLYAYAGAIGAVAWNKYEYVRPDYIVDTAMYYETGLVNGPSPVAKYTEGYYIYAFTLDAYGRIIKTWEIPNDPPHTPSLTGTLTYDANGNLSLPGPELSYDDKVNYFRTNKVWQFIHKNYSRNNLVWLDGNFPTRYNSFGLPLNPRNLERWYIYPFSLGNASRESQIDYACPINKGPIDY